ncbi:MAG: hypothetical protein Q9219_000774 [cf. Caloplaca sp. 3 TL-2023]
MPPSRSPSPPTKRLLQELQDHAHDPLPFLHSLGPKNESDLFSWEAVMRGPADTAYEGGGSSAAGGGASSSQQGAAAGSWTPAYTVSRTLEAIWLLLRYPEVDSPLNVDVAVLLRGGDEVAAEGLVRWGCGEWKWRE